MVESIMRCTCIVVILAVISIANPLYAQQVIYVDQAAAGASDGTSWENAFVSLQDALSIAVEGDEIWVARGVYRPDQGAGVAPGDREASFRIDVPISLYGGFGGTETDLSERELSRNETVLSGDLLSNDSEIVNLEGVDRSDNSFQVVRVETSSTDDDGLIRLDGLTISGGQASGPGASSRGGGIEQVNSRLHVCNTTFENNVSQSGGAALYVFEGIFEVHHSVFRENLTSRGGGAIRAHLFRNSDVIHEGSLIDGVLFDSNHSEQLEGGAISLNGGPLTILNSVFEGNIGPNGGAINLVGGNDRNRTDIINTIFSHNKAIFQAGGAISMEGAHQVHITNSAFLYNSASEASTYSLGGAIARYDVFYENGPDITLVNSLFYGNTAEEAGAIYLTSPGNMYIDNTIFWNNESTTGSSVIIVGNGDDNRIRHSIFEGDIPTGFTTVEAVTDLDPEFMDLTGPDLLPGTGDEDFRVASGSPAINAGDNGVLGADPFDLDGDGNLDEPLPVDLRNFVRIVGPSSTGPIVDIGPYEYNSSPVLIERDANEILRLSDSGEIQIYPNPAADKVHFMVDILHRAALTAELYDALGRRVIQIMNVARSESGVYTIDVSNVTPGSYFLSVTSGKVRRVSVVSIVH